jgi:Cu+-exporting ATPase
MTPSPVETIQETTCHHCGEVCDGSIIADGHAFCCEGCKQVFLLLSENGMCTYYDLGKNPGFQAKGRFASDRFGYLDDQVVTSRLIRFTDGRQTHVAFHLPQMHCASCIWLLENLGRIHEGVISSQTDFQRKEIFIVFENEKTSLKKIVQQLAFIGYEPQISLQDAEKPKPRIMDRHYVYRIGVTGFCFGNIMMLSFPEYFSDGNIGSEGLESVFEMLNLFLSLPVVFFGASEFFVSAWKGLRQRWLNIDAPIALAIAVAFGRSVYEILTGTGAGYLDSMSGIVFFMLIGRWFQQMTYDSLSFDRDYRSYFPLGVTVVRDGSERNVPVADLHKGDHILVRNEEMVPADALLLSHTAEMDYAFVSGENTPVRKSKGDLVYAGGRLHGTAVEMEVVTPVTSSYITKLWNNEAFQQTKNRERSFIHPWSRYFTLALFTVALASGLYWQWHDASRVWPVVTSILIVACPCSLLLSATFTYGNMVRVFGRNRMFLKNASVIEALSGIDTVVFDKTGTMTHNGSSVVSYEGVELDESRREWIRNVSRQSSHPLSRIIADSLATGSDSRLAVTDYREVAGKGLEARVGDALIRMGSPSFVMRGRETTGKETRSGSRVYVSMDGDVFGNFTVRNDYRDGIREVADSLRACGYDLHLLSGDNDREKTSLREILGEDTPLHFRRDPQQKMDYVAGLQREGRRVLMLGDGLNDAGALRQSDVGIAVSDNANLFSPASDAILQGDAMQRFASLLRYARTAKPIVTASFILSILYNLVGLSFATRGLLSPMVAAILMPASSISIVLFVTLLTNLSARRSGLGS